MDAGIPRPRGLGRNEEILTLGAAIEWETRPADEGVRPVRDVRKKKKKE